MNLMNCYFKFVESILKLIMILVKNSLLIMLLFQFMKLFKNYMKIKKIKNFS